MMKPKFYPNLVSFVTVRRNNWVIKVSVFKSKTILIVARHYYDLDKTEVCYFPDQDHAADYIEQLVERE